MFGVGGHLPELIIILVIGLLILGPGKLPQVGSAFGKTIKEFRKGATEAIPDDEEALAPTTKAEPATKAESQEEAAATKK